MKLIDTEKNWLVTFVDAGNCEIVAVTVRTNHLRYVVAEAMDRVATKRGMSLNKVQNETASVRIEQVEA